MSASNEWTEWHLTPEGWVRGSERRDGPGTTLVDYPEGSVLVFRYSEFSGWGMNIERNCYERRKSGSDEEIKVLLEQHGECPRRL